MNRKSKHNASDRNHKPGSAYTRRDPGKFFLNGWIAYSRGATAAAPRKRVAARTPFRATPEDVGVRAGSGRGKACQKPEKIPSASLAACTYRKSEAPSLASSLRMGSAIGATRPWAGTTPLRPSSFLLCTCDGSSSSSAAAALAAARRCSNGPTAEAAPLSCRPWIAAAGFDLLSRGNGGGAKGGLLTIILDPSTFSHPYKALCGPIEQWECVQGTDSLGGVPYFRLGRLILGIASPDNLAAHIVLRSWHFADSLALLLCHVPEWGFLPAWCNRESTLFGAWNLRDGIFFCTAVDKV